MEIIIAFIKVYVVIGWALVHSEMASRNLSTHLVSLGLDSHVKSQNMYNTQGWPIGWAKRATALGPERRRGPNIKHSSNHCTINDQVKKNIVYVKNKILVLYEKMYVTLE